THTGCYLSRASADVRAAMIDSCKPIADLLARAFPLAPVPERVFGKGVSLRQDIPYELANRVQGREWSTVTLDDWRMVGSIDAIRACLSPDAFRYYLPSLLAASIQDRDFVDMGLEALLPSNRARVPYGDWWAAYVGGLTTANLMAIRAYLDYVSSFIVEGTAESAMLAVARELFCTQERPPVGPP